VGVTLAALGLGLVIALLAAAVVAGAALREPAPVMPR